MKQPTKNIQPAISFSMTGATAPMSSLRKDYFDQKFSAGPKTSRRGMVVMNAAASSESAQESDEFKEWKASLRN